MRFEPHGTALIHRIGNLLYIRLESSLNREAVESLLKRMTEERQAFKGTAFLQILDLRKADLFTSEGIEYAFENARDPDGIHPAATVIVLEGTILKRIWDDFYSRPERPRYPVAYRSSCKDAISYLVEQGLVDDNRAGEWHDALKQILKDRDAEI